MGDRERDERLRLLGQTIASVLHDLRSPLTVVQSSAELMAFEGDPKQRLEYSDAISREVLGIEQMTREVQDPHRRRQVKRAVINLARNAAEGRGAPRPHR